ncbi:MAG: 50S ribosomal protein L15 [Chitinophagales bacterium]|nr:50S ribosomal protein L15 [Bacteroidota bacterium]MBX7139930.1 50S ribosomal protein L15 [Chitinophagales bacterium]
MNLSNLKPAKGSVKKVKRIGRGQGSGHGGTSTRGNKGAGQRSGTKVKRGYEGGQMPLQRRVPKHGFKNPFRKEFEVINLDRLQELADKMKLSSVDHESLSKHGIISKNDRVKILGRGEIKSKLEVKVNAVSESAKKAIEAAGGTVHLV